MAVSSAILARCDLPAAILSRCENRGVTTVPMRADPAAGRIISEQQPHSIRPMRRKNRGVTPAAQKS
jgi:hypothetical protein